MGGAYCPASPYLFESILEELSSHQGNTAWAPCTQGRESSARSTNGHQGILKEVHGARGGEASGAAGVSPGGAGSRGLPRRPGRVTCIKHVRCCPGVYFCLNGVRIVTVHLRFRGRTGWVGVFFRAPAGWPFLWYVTVTLWDVTVTLWDVTVTSWDVTVTLWDVTVTLWHVTVM